MVCLLLIAGFCIWGSHRLKTADRNETKDIKVSLLQGNINQYQKWDDKYEKMIRERYENLSIEATKESPDLIVWPESAIPGWYPNEKFYRNWVSDLVRRSSTSHLIGAVSSTRGLEFNAAFLVDDKGRIVSQYNKQHLVPFGEYVPLGKFMGKIIPYLGQLGAFDPGDKTVLFRIGNLTIAPNICFEAIFPGLVRESVLKGADLIVNFTNDGWYLDTGAPEQHYVPNVFRAVELGRPVIRAANTGISAMIDAWGREIFRSELMTSGTFTETVSLSRPHSETLYFKYGPWFSWLSVLGAIFLGFFGWQKKKQQLI